jgi:DNA-binding LytR/AlgR family response regulator
MYELEKTMRKMLNDHHKESKQMMDSVEVFSKIAKEINNERLKGLCCQARRKVVLFNRINENTTEEERLKITNSIRVIMDEIKEVEVVNASKSMVNDV